MEDFLAAQITTHAPVVAFFDKDRAGRSRTPDKWFFGLTSLGLGDNVAVPDRPYLVWREGADIEHREVSETSNARTRTFNFYVYDYKGDFTRINRILETLKAFCKTLVDFTTEDGVHCSGVEWAGVSPDLPDDGYDSCTKYGTVRFTVSR